MSRSVLQFLRRVAEDQRIRALSDAELLRRIVECRDEASFDALLRRHGPMVLDVCRSVLPCAADNEDAFQATFLVLYRKASSVRKPGSLSSWLHGVAYRTALRARATAAKRRQHETQAGRPEAFVADDLSWREVRQLLHEELSRLPDRYRGPVTLCLLEGMSLTAAAEELAVPKNTVQRRLERARALLRARLAGRGLGPANVLLAAWPGATAHGEAPADVCEATAKVRALFFPPEGTPASCPLAVQALAAGVARGLFLAKVKAGLAAAFTVVVLGLGGGLVAWQHGTEDAPRAPMPRPEAERPAKVDQDIAAVRQPIDEVQAITPAARGPTVEDQPLSAAVRRLAESLKRHPVQPSAQEDRLGLFLMELAGRDTAPIAGEVDGGRGYCGSPCWSADGRRILFDATPGKQFDQTRLQAFDVADEDVRHLSLGPGNCATFSPDGKQVAFYVNMGAVPGETEGVYVMNADGANRRRLSAVNGIPKWSPDGRQLLVAGFASPTPVSLVDAQTGALRGVTIPGHRFYSIPSWAGPNTLVAVLVAKAGPIVVLVDVTTPESASVKATLWRSTNGPAVDPAYPVYCPLTKCCVFVGREKGGQALYLLTPGKAAERLEPGRNDRKIASPAFSPDGRYLLFCSDRAG